MSRASRAIIALDTPSAGDALRVVERLGDTADFYKVGLELYTREGPSVVGALRARDKRVFLDLKLHDIPNTVARAVSAACALGVDFLTVHGSGGERMLSAAAAAASGELRLLAVTVLTSLDSEDLGAAWGREVGSVPEEVTRLASLARGSGIHGLVCSSSDTPGLRDRFGDAVTLVVPGIRPAGADRQDQRRVATPAEAVLAGADYLVLGRAVTGSEDPRGALERILDEMRTARRTDP